MLENIDLHKLVGRNRELFISDIYNHQEFIHSQLESAKILVVGASGSIGSAVVKELLQRSVKCVHAVDLSENNLVELVRHLRSSPVQIKGEFLTFSIDLLSDDFEEFYSSHGPYDYVLNFSALKHVRSERDIFTLRRMFRTNVYGAAKLKDLCDRYDAKKYFCVSTDKAANPVNLMGASKRIMELVLDASHHKTEVSMARFANVAFSDGSLPCGFLKRFSHGQPLSAPIDIKRYFLTHTEAGRLCLLSALLGSDNEIYFPKLEDGVHLKTFSEIAISLVKAKGYDPVIFDSEEEAKQNASSVISKNGWPCYFFETNTAGEKPFEEFFTFDESPFFDGFEDVGVVKGSLKYDQKALLHFKDLLSASHPYSRDELIQHVQAIIPEFDHFDKGANLDQKM